MSDVRGRRAGAAGFGARARHRRVHAPIAVGALGVVGIVWVSSIGPAHVGSGGAVAGAPLGSHVAAEVVATVIRPVDACTGEFARRELDHVTVSDDRPARLFDSNGAGVAAGDLDGDGRPDLVFGNLDGPNTIMWNEGDFRFTTERMDDRSTRTVQLVDIDGDGALDIVTTHRAGGVRWWHNSGDRGFESRALRGVAAPAYAMSWADYDGDGDLDFATGSYDAELDQRLRSSFLFSDGAGIYVYTNDGAGRFTGDRLAAESQALTANWLDLDHNGRPELVIGNDFAMEDMVWRRSGDRWEPIRPFDLTAAHTMSFDGGDVDNDGVEELFATDMKPTSTDTDVLAAWMPLIASMDGLDVPSGTQRIRNVLLVASPDGRWVDRGDEAGVDAAGWAWSARFGDLDNDGDLDLHVANGMIAAETFPYLDGAELVERNATFVNQGTGSFRVDDEWALDDPASGRGSIIVDLDGDGRLDVVVNNMSSSAVVFSNGLCAGSAIEFVLAMPGTANTSAIGATVSVDLGDGTAVRSVRSGGGYLSGSSNLLHVGVGDRRDLERAVIRWPDGTVTVIDDPAPGTRYEVTRP